MPTTDEEKQKIRDWLEKKLEEAGIGPLLSGEIIEEILALVEDGSAVESRLLEVYEPHIHPESSAVALAHATYVKIGQVLGG